MSSQKIRRQGLSSNEKMNISLEENALSSNATTQKLFTPCRRVGLNRKRKTLSPIVDINLTSSESKKNNVSEVQNNDNSVSEPTNILPDFSENDSPKGIIPKKKIVLQKKRKIDNNTNDDELTQNNSLEVEKKLKLTQSEDTNKVSTMPVSINISRCNLDALNLKVSLSEEKTYETSIESEPSISTSKDESTLKEPNLEIISNENTKEITEKSVNKILSGNNSLDDSDGSDFYPNVTRRKKKKILTNKQRSTPKPGPSKQKENIKNNKNKVANNLNYDSDSDDDFISKPRRDRNSSLKAENNPTAKEDKNKLKKIITPFVDEFNKTDHIRIAENKSYTIIHKDNVVSYVKCYDNDVNFKVTESDDNQQEPARNPVIYPKKSMILERKDYLPKNPNISTEEAVLLEMPSMFEDIIHNLDEQEKIEKTQTNETTKEKNETKEVTIKQLKDELVALQNKVKIKQERVERLKRISVYKESHNLEELQELTLKFKRGSQEALIDLLLLLKQHSETPFGMPTLLSYLKVSNKLIGYNEEEDKFM